MIELRDQIFDALRDVAPPLVQLEDLLVEASHPPLALLDLALQGRMLVQQAAMLLEQRADRAFQPLEV